MYVRTYRAYYTNYYMMSLCKDGALDVRTTIQQQIWYVTKSVSSLSFPWAEFDASSFLTSGTVVVLLYCFVVVAFFYFMLLECKGLFLPFHSSFHSSGFFSGEYPFLFFVFLYIL